MCWEGFVDVGLLDGGLGWVGNGAVACGVEWTGVWWCGGGCFVIRERWRGEKGWEVSSK